MTKPIGGAGVATLIGGTLMAAIDVSIANVAAPTIADDLAANNPQIELILCSYGVAYAAFLILGAQLGTRWGHRTCFLIGLSSFTAFSLLCGLSGSAELLVVFRVGQGLGAALMVPQVFTSIQLFLSGEPRSRALGYNAAVVAVGGVVGQLIGGALVSADVAGMGWRTVFLINVPVGLVLLVLAAKSLPKAITRAAEIDGIGFALLAIFLGALMTALIFGPHEHWRGWPVGLAATALIALTVLVLHLRRRARTGSQLAFNPAVVRNRPVALGLLTIAASMIAYGGFLISFTAHQQVDHNISAAGTGLAFSLYAFGFAAASLRASRTRLRQLSLAGFAIMAIAHAIVGTLLDSAGVTVWAGATLVLGGAGYGLGFTATVARTLGSASTGLVAQTSGILNVVIQVGYILGVATIGNYYLASSGLAYSSASSSFGRTSILITACAAVALVLAVTQGASIRTRSSKSPR